jgi:hypothetical protein
MIKKIKFSIPYNGDLKLISWAIKSGQVREVYFASTAEYGFSNPYDHLTDFGDDDLVQLIKICSKNKIETNFLLNKNISFFEDLGKIYKYIKFLQSAGPLTTITLSDQYLTAFLRRDFPEIRLQSSIYMGIDNVGKAKEAIKMGLSSLGLDPSINRNHNELAKIYKLKEQHQDLTIKLLGVHGCYSNCFYAWRHSELPVLKKILDDSKQRNSKNILGNLINISVCHYDKKEEAEEIRRSFIRPEDVWYYEKYLLCDTIKIAYRDESSSVLRQKFTAFFSRTYKGNLCKILNSNKHQNLYCNNQKFPRGFIQKVMQCDKNCETCDYCAKVFKLVSK